MGLIERIRGGNLFDSVLRAYRATMSKLTTPEMTRLLETAGAAVYRRYLVNFFRKQLRIVGTPPRIEFKSSENRYKNRKNILTKRQVKHVKEQATRNRPRRGDWGPLPFVALLPTAANNGNKHFLSPAIRYSLFLQTSPTAFISMKQ